LWRAGRRRIPENGVRTRTMEGEETHVSRDDNVKVEGTVVKVHSGGMYQVETDDGRSIRTKLSGRMSRFRIKVLLGDRVTVALSPYDLTHGLIVYRGK
jgi:translation initiation factor IF-1